MQSTIKEHVLLRPLYKKAMDGLPVLGTPAETAARYYHPDTSMRQQSENMIRVYVGLSGASGFVTGLPGFLLSLITVPADVAGVALLQLHMCASIATAAGYDPTSPATRNLCIDCLLGSGVLASQDEAEETKKRFGRKVLERGLRFGAGRVVKFVTSRATRVVPVLGGVIGATSDVRLTRQVGENAQRLFLTQPALTAETV